MSSYFWTNEKKSIISKIETNFIMLWEKYCFRIWTEEACHDKKLLLILLKWLLYIIWWTMYRKVASFKTSHLEAYAGFFRLLIQGIFDPYIKKLISSLVMPIRTRDYTVLTRMKLFQIGFRLCQRTKKAAPA